MHHPHLDLETLARLAEGGTDGLSQEDWRHLSACEECHAAYVEAQRIVADWEGAAPAPVDPALLERGLAVHPKHRIDGRVVRRWSRALSFATGGLAVAAALVCMALLPPRPIGAGPAFRGNEPARFQHPVEGEVLDAGSVHLHWSAVPGASAYRVQLRDGQGEVVYEGRSEGRSLSVPSEALGSSGRYRALLSTEPRDLLLPGSVSVAFRTGSLGARALHQFRWAERWILALAVAGLLLALTGLLRPRRVAETRS